MEENQFFATGSYPGLHIDPTSSEFTQQSKFGLTLFPDTYLTDILTEEHINWIVKDNKDYFVVSIILNSTSQTLRALKTTHRGYQEMKLPLSDIMDASLLKPHVIDPNSNSESEFFLITDPLFPQDFMLVEQKHPQARSVMKIGIIYCKKGQTTAAQMFENTECSPGFWKFVNGLGEKIDLDGWTKYRGDMRPPGFAWYTIWRGIEVVFHVAPILNAEEKRRLIGNDIAMLFYFDEPSSEKFCPEGLDTFGEVPCVFAVVQPTKSKSKSPKEFKIGFCQKINITPHSPNAPLNPQTFENTKDMILTKLHNGLVLTIFCPPMNRLFTVPRRATLHEIVEKWITKTGQQASSSPKQGSILSQFKDKVSDVPKVGRSRSSSLTPLFRGRSSSRNLLTKSDGNEEPKPKKERRKSMASSDSLKHKKESGESGESSGSLPVSRRDSLSRKDSVSTKKGPPELVRSAPEMIRETDHEEKSPENSPAHEAFEIYNVLSSRSPSCRSVSIKKAPTNPDLHDSSK